jgi:hypothetical protein
MKCKTRNNIYFKTKRTTRVRNLQKVISAPASHSEFFNQNSYRVLQTGLLVNFVRLTYFCPSDNSLAQKKNIRRVTPIISLLE